MVARIHALGILTILVSSSRLMVGVLSPRPTGIPEGFGAGDRGGGVAWKEAWVEWSQHAMLAAPSVGGRVYSVVQRRK